MSGANIIIVAAKSPEPTRLGLTFETVAEKQRGSRDLDDGRPYFRFGVFGLEVFGLGIVAQPYSTIAHIRR